LGLKKFLDVVWLKDPHSGEANFDIHGERIGTNQLVMFEARKILEFQEDLEKKLLSQAFSSDSAIYLHMLQSGFLNRHARPIVSRLCKEKRIAFVDGHGKRARPRLSNDSVSQPRPIAYMDGQA
jgi:hypothetical protein